MSASKDTDPVDMNAYVETVAHMIDLPIPPASKPVVIANLEVARRMAVLLDEFELDEREEPTPVYRP